MSTAVDVKQVILDRIAVRQVARAQMEAQDATDMLEFADVCRAESERQGDPRVRDLEASFAADELGVVLHQPPRTVQIRLSQARRVRNLLPQTWVAFGKGRIDAYRISCGEADHASDLRRLRVNTGGLGCIFESGGPATYRCFG